MVEVEFCVGSYCACDKAVVFVAVFDVGALLLFDCGGDGVYDDAEDKRGCYGSDGDCLGYYAVSADLVRDLDGESADTRDEDGRYREEVLVVAEVDVFEHLKSGYCDESVEGQAYTAHCATRYGSEESHKRADEAQYYAHNCCRPDGRDGSVLGDCYATYALAVSGVGADSEYGTGYGAYAVAEKGLFESGFAFDEVSVDDGTEVLMVCDVLCEYYECYGDEGKRYFAEACRTLEEVRCSVYLSFAVYDFFNTFDKSEVGVSDEALDLLTDSCGFTAESREVIDERAPVDYFEVIDVESVSEDGENRSGYVTCRDTEDERYKASHLELLLGGADDDGYEGDNTAEKTYKVVCAVYDVTVCLYDIGHCSTCKAQTDDCDGRSDNNGRHELGNPFGARELNYECDYYVNKTREDTAEDYAEVTERKRRNKGAYKCERAGDDYRALRSGKE